MRKSYNGEVCTIRYSGPIPAWNEVAYGVEWDNPGRGKHNGALNGQQYFDCQVENAGSFLKATKPSDPTLSFSQAVLAKYTENYEYTEISLSRTKAIESVGMEKYFNRQKQIENLETVSVSKCCVDRFDDGVDTSLPLTSLKHLDLSHNIFEDLGEAVEVLSRYRLESLNLSHNRFSKLNLKSQLPTVTELNLGSTLLDAQQLAMVLTAFPNVKRLGLSRNMYKSYPLDTTNDFDWIDLAYNELTTVPLLGRHLVLNDNKIASLSVPVQFDSLNLYEQQTSFQMSLTDIDNLLVKELWLTEANHSRAAIIGRLGRLEKLNGTVITQEERRDSELYVWSQLQKSQQPSLPLERQQYLQSVYGQRKQAPPHSIAARLVKVVINGNHFEQVGDTTVQSFLSLVGRKTGKRAITLSLELDGRLVSGDELLKDIIKGDGEQLELHEDPEFLHRMFA